MVLDRLYRIDRISSSGKLSGKQFMMTLSWKMELRWISVRWRINGQNTLEFVILGLQKKIKRTIACPV